jgi:hypothetical protein
MIQFKELVKLSKQMLKLEKELTNSNDEIEVEII